jgi:predicted DNA-binding transcriptional regulator AlpA
MPHPDTIQPNRANRRAAVRARLGFPEPPATGGGRLATEERFINFEELKTLIPVGEMTFWRWIRNPDVAFPEPVKLGDNGRNFWWLPTIREWTRQREDLSSHRRPRSKPTRLKPGADAAPGLSADD